MKHEPLRILVVDDNAAIHEDFRKILSVSTERDVALQSMEAVLFGSAAAPKAPQFALDFAQQGQEALAKVEAAVADGRPYALAFVDIRMPPGWDGVETIVHLWNADPALEVVICTAYSDCSWEKMSQRFGPTDQLLILKKPFDNVEVRQMAHALARKWRLNQQARRQLDELDRLVAERTLELRRSEERFATAFRSSPVAMAIQEGEDGAFVDLNDAFLALTGFERDQIVRMQPVSIDFRLEPVDGTSGANEQCAATLVIGSRLRKEVLVSTAKLHVGGIPHRLIILQDISERLRLESQLRQSQKMEAIGQLAAGVAHDFNNLLTIIEGHASLQLASTGLTADTVDSLEQIEHAAERAADLTRQLLAFSRKQIMRPRAIDVGAIIGGLLSMLRRVLGERIEIRCDVPPGLPLILADQTSVEQVIMNLTLNARDAMPEGGVISLGAGEAEVTTVSRALPLDAATGSYTYIEVADTGVGMDEATRARIIEPFFTTKPVNKGTGMGLATVYGITRQHNGWIDVQTTPGKGSTFRVYFPATDLTPDTEMPLSAALPRQGTERTILLVEDDVSVRSLVREMLEHFKYRVIEASSGDEALERWPAIRDEVDLLLTDVVMPGQHSGLDLARKLIADEPGLKVIFSSGYSAELFSSDVPLVEGVNYLPKPYLTSTLLSIVRTALEKSLKPAGSPI
jgi:two-component system cell cycle sensor histidine kinase/response regulator CckA